VDAIIPTGTCVATDTSSLTLITNRFTSSDPRCSSLIDPVGTAYALAGGRNALSGAARSRSFEAAWLAALRPARFVLLNCFPPSDSACNLTTNRRLPWAGPAGAYFTAHFRKVTGVPEYLFERINAPAG
jgi:hypothetical protein